MSISLTSLFQVMLREKGRAGGTRVDLRPELFGDYGPQEGVELNSPSQDG